MLAITPGRSALTSRSIFSVSSSTSGSPAATRSPAFLSHFTTRASTTDSPSSGTTMLVMLRYSQFAIRFSLAGCRLPVAGLNLLGEHSLHLPRFAPGLEDLFDDGALVDGVPGGGPF